MAGEWPLGSYLELGALPTAVSCVRLHAKHVLWEWGLAGLSETIELLVSELVTNALKASWSMEGGHPVRMWLLSAGPRVLILVWDGCPKPPVRAQVDVAAESGRGLLLVEALSERSGWYTSPELGGKLVWPAPVGQSLAEALGQIDTAAQHWGRHGGTAWHTLWAVLAPPADEDGLQPSARPP
jgi:anti-sigma regulatory factor (Ser/Thr protein kinase)